MTLVRCSDSRVVDVSTAFTGLCGGFWGRRSFLLCLFAPTGKRFCMPQTLHSITRTLAHGFLPPILLFSVKLSEVVSGRRSVLHLLQSERLTLCERRIWLLNDTARRCDSRRRCMPSSGVSLLLGDVGCCKPSMILVWFAISPMFDGLGSPALGLSSIFRSSSFSFG